jgi:folate-dependent phosphoribosylglycinamide formyltransferase PurN
VKALLVTSRVTYAPGNYDDLVCGAPALPQIGGLLVLDNGSLTLAARAVGFGAAGARGIGAHLLANYLGRSMARRKRAYAVAGKRVWELPTINSPDAVQLVEDQGFDLVVNARTRDLYQREILAAPRLGCINIHHGLLPEQRGAMCDLWALREHRPAGFSIHVMTAEVDAGPILTRVQVSAGDDRDYPAYLARSTRRELIALAELLAGIEARDVVRGTPNQRATPRADRTPGWREVGHLRRAGLRI